MGEDRSAAATQALALLERWLPDLGLGVEATRALAREAGPSTTVISVRPREVAARPAPSGPRALLESAEVVAALQVLVEAALARHGHPAGAVLLRTADTHPAGREEGLAEAARALARQVVATGRPAAIGPMGVEERREVHAAAGEVPDVWTQSEGDGSFRRLWILPRERRPTPPGGGEARRTGDPGAEAPLDGD